MAESIIQKAGGGAASDECTAGRAQVLAGYTAVTKDSGDEPAEGTMTANGSMDASLNCGQSKKIPAGYTPGGTVTANSLASQTGGATAEDRYVLNGKTYWKDGVKRTGSMTVASVASFSVAPYSTSQVLATWKNPGRGPYSGVAICAKTGGYPANINDGRVYTGVGNNSVVNGTSSQIISGLAAGTTYYFRIWVYLTCSAGDQYSGYLQATCVPTAHGRAYFTQSGTWTVPANVRSINIHCTGGGGCGYFSYTDYKGGGGGAGGYTSYKNNISVSPGEQIQYVVGSGAPKPGGGSASYIEAGSSSASINGATLVSANGAKEIVVGSNANTYSGADGGSGGGSGKGKREWAPTNGGSNGSDGGFNGHEGKGQGSSTREFGTGTLYSGGGGGGGYANSNESWALGGRGGAGGGGNGGGRENGNIVFATDGSKGTGGGAGGLYSANSQIINNQYEPKGGSGNVVITW